MSHPLQRGFWTGVPAVVVVGYTVLAMLAAEDMALGEAAAGGVLGGLLIVVVYWALWGTLRWLDPRGVR